MPIAVWIALPEILQSHDYAADLTAKDHALARAQDRARIVFIAGWRKTDAIEDPRLRSALSDCAGTIIYSRRRKVFLETHWVASTSCRVSYRVVADLGGTAMGC
jgi:hypothetical protein